MNKAYSTLLARIPGGTFCRNIAQIVKPPQTNVSVPSATMASSLHLPSCFDTKVEVSGASTDRWLGPLGLAPPAFGALFAAYVSRRDNVDIDTHSLVHARPFIESTKLGNEEVDDRDVAYLAAALFTRREKRIQVLDPFFERVGTDSDVWGGIVTHALRTLAEYDQQFSAEQQSS